ncbi:MAG: basic membrane protein-domain-containing protein [Olpidium bornovanus]|uniref:Basic membrane protein-domain-containing protein n=1 Tax=Olpidium bornovanus TaxID=278681 RepID=A0A8H7ZUZ6_9FUNG|nr:MAG: basic membrane protein-domain-containing protein [Olpidium bornovanus]
MIKVFVLKSWPHARLAAGAHLLLRLSDLECRLRFPALRPFACAFLRFGPSPRARTPSNGKFRQRLGKLVEHFQSAVASGGFGAGGVCRRGSCRSHDPIILAGYQWQSYAEALDARYATRATFSIVDAGIEQPLSSFQGIMFAEDQLGFLAGVVAGLFTRTKRVGVVPGIPIKVIWRFRNGYLKGVHHSCPDCDTYGDYVPSFTNSALGIQAAQKLLQQGVDVIFGAAGGTGSAAIYWAATSGTRVIGVDAVSSFGVNDATGFRTKAFPRLATGVTP